MTSADPTFTFSVDLAVVESLGINLYSNAAAVLSELVANAWDADANNVTIKWNTSGDEIVIHDDGRGMTKSELNSRYLTVAYKKRDEEGHSSPLHGRPFMGRKGIGKLSVFSLAGDVTLFTKRNGSASGFNISVDQLRAKIAAKEPYHPDPVTPPADLPEHGTRIILKNLNRRRTGVSVAALRRRLARRFDTLNYADSDPGRFQITIDGRKISYEDRDDLKLLEYMWQLGSVEIDGKQTPNIVKQWLVSDNVIDARRGWSLQGWFGTVREPKQLKDPGDTQESLRNIIILARRRPIQEGILDQLDFNKLFGSYVTGQIHAEFLDLDDGSDDIATSDRQRLIEDDERVTLLVKKLRDLFNSAAEQWSSERPKQKFKELTLKYPVVQEWVDKRPEHQRESARRVMGTVGALQLDKESYRPALYKSSILAFERIALDATTKELEKFANGLYATDILPLLANARSYEDALYVQILRSRLEAIEKLESMINKDELEKVLQKHLFENMWLLDPSWEGATGDADMEISLNRVRRGILFDKSEAENHKKGRIDIQYRSAAGVHMIVELKKYGRKTSIDELIEQGGKYHEALSEVLRKRSEPVRDISVVFVLGQEPNVGYLGGRELGDVIDGQLEHIDGRVLYYDELLSTAQKRYSDYRERKKDLTELDRVIAALDADT
ncbi:ATP-binding protein [Rhodococcus sp. 14-2470-1a]|uniref:BbrUII/HgiDII family restriction enzyme n=1 Tax=Rhodococcus sp. 14-2470-1a TaxID=2023150 RepID=UPI0015C689AC|nr:ATP-binding protein [Rhodococcus sp. 14-2470-1a]